MSINGLFTWGDWLADIVPYHSVSPGTGISLLVLNVFPSHRLNTPLTINIRPDQNIKASRLVRRFVLVTSCCGLR